MNLFDIPGKDRVSALRALKTIALANGPMEDAERAMLRAAASAYRSDADLEALEPITGEALAEAVHLASQHSPAISTQTARSKRTCAALAANWISQMDGTSGQ